MSDKSFSVSETRFVFPGARRRAALARRLAANPAAKVAAFVTAAAFVLIVSLAPLASFVIEGWLRQDIEIRSRLIARSVRNHLLASGPESSRDLGRYLEQMVEDERLLALGYCSDAGVMLHATASMPKSISCRDFGAGKTNAFDVDSRPDPRAHVNAVSVGAGPTAGRLVVVHDLSFIDERSRKASYYTILALTGVTMALGLLATSVVLMATRGWARSVRSAILAPRAEEALKPLQAELPGGRDFRALLQALRVERKFTEGIYVEWSPATLGQLLAEELPQARVVIVSNREPYIHNYADGKPTLQIPASGLVAALEPVMRACGGVWVAHGSGAADRETVDEYDRIAVPPNDPAYSLRRVWLSDEEQDGYYYGLANEGLWPLCHIAFVRPNFREQDWSHYVAVNRKFAEVVIEEAECDDPIVLVQDYHFALLPRMIRDRLPNATIIAFWHIPWPNSETFGICPWREQIIDGLLGSTILGFHTQFHCNNFIDAVDRFMESRIDRETGSITLRGHETMVRPYPISIEWPPSALANQLPVEECRKELRRRLHLGDDMHIAIGIERFDYTKGVLDRIRAVDAFLSLHPEWLEKFVFIQAAAPTRSKLPVYSSLQAEARRLVDEINGRHGRNGWKPILLEIRHHEQGEVYALFRAADVCIVSSLHDGMNLVAKEFVAAREDEQGVLILSSFAGASRELSEALIVNPYDAHGMAEAIQEALKMPSGEQRERMRLMRELIRRDNVYSWAAQMLLHAARLRKSERLHRLIGQ